MLQKAPTIVPRSKDSENGSASRGAFRELYVGLTVSGLRCVVWTVVASWFSLDIQYLAVRRWEIAPRLVAVSCDE